MRIAAYQFAVSGNIHENYREIDGVLRLAKSQGVRLLLFPECALTGYPPRDIPTSSCVDFALVRAMREKLQSFADENDISFVVGTVFREREIYDRALLFRPGRETYSYDKRALWGWDRENFAKGSGDGVFELEGVRFGIRICFEVRFPEFFRELYKKNTDIDLVLFYDVTDADDPERYELLKGHLRTRAVENVTTVVSVNAVSPFQTAPTMVVEKTGKCVKECARNRPELLVYDFKRTENDFSAQGRIAISDQLLFG